MVEAVDLARVAVKGAAQAEQPVVIALQHRLPLLRGQRSAGSLYGAGISKPIFTAAHQ
ncbi:MAG: hypothetical protein JWR25_1828 [Noviherbaspirillum sp.]|jgi:hypothetical protein|nr:hypothetical protein [Noviherbaspirillum sp.]MDB5795449.1 hypothetical protein [Noviherbaspirillum sp.]